MQSFHAVYGFGCRVSGVRKKKTWILDLIESHQR